MTTASEPARAAEGVPTRAETSFRRVLRLPALVFFGLAYMVPLTVWTTYGVVTSMTEGHLPAAYLVTTIAMLFTAYSYGRMVVAQPLSGSAYSYASRSFGRPFGFMVGWALLLDYVFLPMINYLVVGLYLADYFPSVPRAVWIVIAVLLVTGLNVLGVKLLASMNIVLVVAQFVFIVVFAALAVRSVVSHAPVRSFTAPFYDSGMHLGLVFAGAAVLALSFLGFDAVSTLAEETEDPRRRIPTAILLCALIGGAVYIVQSYLGHLAFPNFAEFADHADVAGADVMRAIGGDFLNSFFTATFVASGFACAMASQASVARVLFAMGRDGSLPRSVFGWLHRRFRTPVVANLVVGVCGLTALFLTLDTASSMISFGALAAFSVVNLTVIKHYLIDGRRRGAGNVLTYGVLPAFGVLVTLYLWTQLSRLTFIIGLSWLVVGFGYLLWLTRLFRREPPALYTGDEDY